MSAGAIGDSNTAKKLSSPFKINGQYVDASYDVNLGDWTARQHGWIAWAYDPLNCTGETDLLEGYLFLTAVLIPADGTPINNIIVNVTTAGSGLSSGQCKAALFQNTDGDADFELVGTTATQHTAWQSTGVTTMALTAPVICYGKPVYAGIWYKGTTSPKFGCKGATPAGNFNATYAGFTRFGADSTGGLTTTPPSAIATVTGYNPAIWMALS